jgi:hypothetical protein
MEEVTAVLYRKALAEDAKKDAIRACAECEEECNAVMRRIPAETKIILPDGRLLHVYGSYGNYEIYNLTKLEPR